MKVGILLAFLLFPVLTLTPAPVSYPEHKNTLTEELRYPDKEIALLLLKRWEGFIEVAKWDVDKFRNGWGTPSRAGERITVEEADRRTLEIFDKVFNQISRTYPNLPEWERLVFSVMQYNVGSFGTGLDTALRAGDIPRASEIMLKYVHSNGEKLQGLENRRQEENRLLLSCPEDRQIIALELEQIVFNHIRK